MNWKPYWGGFEKAEILHFHRPKPPHVRSILNGKSNGLPKVIIDLHAKAPETFTRSVEL